MGWRLLSNRQVGTLEQAVELIDWYRARWEIELFFLILKEGCRIEALQLGSAERIETALATWWWPGASTGAQPARATG